MPIEMKTDSPKRQILHELLSNVPAFDYQKIWDSDGVFFGVDWREHDEEITKACESILKTRCLSSSYHKHDNGDFTLLIHYKNQEFVVPLTHSPEDRHITLHTLNQILMPEYEIRLLIESAGDDTLGFLPLEAKYWEQLEARYATVYEVFAKITESPNLFTQGYSYVPEPTWQELAVQDKSVAIKHYKHVYQCGLMEAKKAVEEYIEHL